MLYQLLQQRAVTKGHKMAKITDKKIIEKLGQKKALKKLSDAAKPEAPKTYIGFVRVSTDRQMERGDSVETQIQLIQNFCLRRGWVLSDIEILAESSSKAKRPKFAAFLKRILP